MMCHLPNSHNFLENASIIPFQRFRKNKRSLNTDFMICDISSKYFINNLQRHYLSNITNLHNLMLFVKRDFVEILCYKSAHILEFSYRIIQISIIHS